MRHFLTAATNSSTPAATRSREATVEASLSATSLSANAATTIAASTVRRAQCDGKGRRNELTDRLLTVAAVVFTMPAAILLANLADWHRR